MHPTAMLTYADDMTMGRRGFGLNTPGPSLVVATDHNPVYSSDMKTIEDTTKLDETELILSSPIVYGFSLSDKVWRALSVFSLWIFYADTHSHKRLVEFDVDNVTRFEWDDEPFENLVLAKDQKELVQSLVEAHTLDKSGFDDFVKGKGKGLVMNLFGNPGVGKSLTAEATSERKFPV